jgi:aryl-alcohol dehydrogenase-like predicted oxidoreductase
VQWQRWQQVEFDDLLEEMTSMSFILRFTFSHPDMDTNIVGTINPAHLQDNLDALLEGPLPTDVYTEAKRRLAEVGLRPQN